jgi:hypothetical protein
MLEHETMPSLEERHAQYVDPEGSPMRTGGEYGDGGLDQKNIRLSPAPLICATSYEVLAPVRATAHQPFSYIPGLVGYL